MRTVLMLIGLIGGLVFSAIGAHPALSVAIVGFVYLVARLQFAARGVSRQ